MGLCQKLWRQSKKLAINAAPGTLKLLTKSDFVKGEWSGEIWKVLYYYAAAVGLSSGNLLYGVCGLGTLGGWSEDFLKDTATFPEILTATNPPSDCRRLARNRPHDFHRRKSLRQREQGWSESIVAHEETSLSET